MPNWCFTQIIFHGNKTEIEDFHKKVTEWTSESLAKSDFGNIWLGNILVGAGLGDRIDSGPTMLRCRGTLSYIDEIEDDGEDNAIFRVDTETAWAPMTLMWKAVIDKLEYKTIGFSYMAEEPGCEVYEIYDPYGDYDEHYYVDVFIDGEDCENESLQRLDNSRYFASDETLVYALQKLLNTEETNIATLIKQAESYPFKNEDSYISVHKYDIVDELY